MLICIIMNSRNIPCWTAKHTSDLFLTKKLRNWRGKKLKKELGGCVELIQIFGNIKGLTCSTLKGGGGARQEGSGGESPRGKLPQSGGGSPATFRSVSSRVQEAEEQARNDAAMLSKVAMCSCAFSFPARGG